MGTESRAQYRVHYVNDAALVQHAQQLCLALRVLVPLLLATMRIVYKKLTIIESMLQIMDKS